MSDAAFVALFHRWETWSEGADRAEDGWQSDFPEWSSLMAAAEAVMMREHPDDATLAMLARCWAASDEGEHLQDFARDHLAQCWGVLERLSTSELSACRWQVYAALGAAGSRGEPVLRRGLSDPDPYARRRAVLALARLRPPDAVELAERYMADPDPYLRQSALELIRPLAKSDFRSRALQVLASDPVEHVRAAARTLLG